MEIQIRIDKASVYEEVAKLTSYVGAKLPDDGSGYNRIFTTDQDRHLLERYWEEACTATTNAMAGHVKQATGMAVSHGVEKLSDFELTLRVSERSSAGATLQTAIFNYFVNYIASRWFMLTNKEEVQVYTALAQGLLKEARNIIYNKQPPQYV